MLRLVDTTNLKGRRTLDFSGNDRVLLTAIAYDKKDTQYILRVCLNNMGRVYGYNQEVDYKKLNTKVKLNQGFSNVSWDMLFFYRLKEKGTWDVTFTGQLLGDAKVHTGRSIPYHFTLERKIDLYEYYPPKLSRYLTEYEYRDYTEGVANKPDYVIVPADWYDPRVGTPNLMKWFL